MAATLTLALVLSACGGEENNSNNNLNSPENTHDVVEVGNTQSPTYTNVKAFRDISHLYEELGGGQLLEGFVEVGPSSRTTPLARPGSKASSSPRSRSALQ